MSRPRLDLPWAATVIQNTTTNSSLYLDQICGNFFCITVQLRMYYIYQNTILYIQCTITSGKVLIYVYVYICKSYVYLPICGGRKRPDIIQNHNRDKVRKYYDYITMDPFYNQNVYWYICMLAYITQRSSYLRHIHPLPSVSITL